MKIFLSSDHAGFELKQEMEKYLLSIGHTVTNCGPHTYNEQDDYPDTIPAALIALQQSLTTDTESCAIIFGGSGQGEAIVANRYDGVRAGLYYGGNLDIIRLLREHNNANVLSLGARMIHSDEAKAAVTLFLETSFSNIERHARRITKIEALKK